MTLPLRGGWPGGFAPGETPAGWGALAGPVYARATAEGTPAASAAITALHTAEVEAVAVPVGASLAAHGRILEFIWAGTLAPGEELVVDAETMTVELDGVNARPDFSGDYIVLWPGGQDVIYHDGEAARTAEIEVKWRDHWA